jgi:predicted DNA-binding transcriptional regulator YafY
MTLVARQKTERVGKGNSNGKANNIQCLERCMRCILFALRNQYFTIDDMQEELGFSDPSTARRYIKAMKQAGIPIVITRPYKRGKNFRTTGRSLFKLDKTRL